MSMIEGVGDEVVQFFVIVFIMLLILAAWQSTSVRRSNMLHAAFWLQARMLQARMRRQMLANRNNTPQRRPRFMGHFIHQSEPDRDGQRSTGTSTEQIHRDQSPTSPQNPVKIKLQFANATVKTIEADLNETVGEFKRKNFPSDLSRGNTIMLIFSGRILRNDDQTLASYGLFGDCVVHCLIRDRSLEPYSPRPRRGGSDRVFSTAVLNALSPWLLMAFWYARFYFSELFTPSSTTALGLLTVLYLAFLAGSYLPPPGTNTIAVER